MLGPYMELAKLWPIYFLFYLALQFILPRAIRLFVDKNDIKWNWLHGQTRSGGRAAEYAAYLLISGGIVIFCSLLAIEKWSDIQDIPIPDRLDQNIPEAQLLASIMLAYQLYNFSICFLLPDDCGRMDNYLHHAATALLAYFVLHPYAHYYAFFFVGVAELSNVPLTIVDACRSLPKLGEMIPNVNIIARVLFAISFFVIRVFWWPYISYQFWWSSIERLSNGTAHSNVVVFIFLTFNVGLTFLQFFWAKRIGMQMLKMVGIVKSKTSSNQDQKEK